MGVGVARNGDPCGLPSYSIATPSVVVATSTDTFANSLAMAKEGDTLSLHYHWWGSHWWPEIDRIFLPGSGSGTVKVNGQGVIRVGDCAACTCKVISGSLDTFSG